MGITGTWEGFVSDPAYIFNYGTWGNVSPTGFSNMYESGGELIANTTDGVIIYYRTNNKSNFTIDVSNYNYLKVNVVTISNNSKLSAYTTINVYNSSDTIVASASETRTVSQSAWRTISCDVSNIYQKVYLKVTFMATKNNSVSFAKTGKINQIYLSKS